MWFGCGSDAVRKRFGSGSDVVRMWFGCGSDVFSDVVRMWLRHVFGSGADSLAEVKGKWFPAGSLKMIANLQDIRFLMSRTNSSQP